MHKKKEDKENASAMFQKIANAYEVCITFIIACQLSSMWTISEAA